MAAPINAPTYKWFLCACLACTLLAARSKPPSHHRHPCLPPPNITPFPEGWKEPVRISARAGSAEGGNLERRSIGESFCKL